MTICEQVSAVAEQCLILLPVVGVLTELTSSSYGELAKSAVIALVNITSSAPESISHVVGCNGASRQLEIGSHIRERLMLLVNLTRDDGAVDQLVQSGQLRRLALLLFEEVGDVVERRGLPVVEDAHAYAAMAVVNVSRMPAARRQLLEWSFVLPGLLSAIAHGGPARRRGAVAIVRNLCIDRASHTDLIRVGVVRSLAGPVVPLQVRSPGAEVMIRAAIPRMRFEHEVVVRRELLEALFLLAQSREGCTALRQHAVALVMRELDDVETDDGNKDLALRIGARLLAVDGCPC